MALDWCAGTPLEALARHSFGRHAALPDEIAGDWGYRPMMAYAPALSLPSSMLVGAYSPN